MVDQDQTKEPHSREDELFAIKVIEVPGYLDEGHCVRVYGKEAEEILAKQERQAAWSRKYGWTIYAAFGTIIFMLFGLALLAK